MSSFLQDLLEILLLQLISTDIHAFVKIVNIFLPWYIKMKAMQPLETWTIILIVYF